MKKILVVTNSMGGLYNFRFELLYELSKKYQIIIVSPPSGLKIKFQFDNCKVIESKIERKSKNIFHDLKLLFSYLKIIRLNKPDIILTYTIKPNIYGGIAARLTKTPYITNITGLGNALKDKGVIRLLSTRLYKVALKKSNMVFFQNQENMNFMLKKKIIGKAIKLVPGSGVNIEHFNYIEYPKTTDLHFLYIGRIMKAKGIETYLNAAKLIVNEYSNVFFHVLGTFEEDYKDIIREYQEMKFIKYHGNVTDVRSFHQFSHATVHPSFHEGMSNVLLEAAASGRPVIASKIPGCIETFDQDVSGFGFITGDVDDLAKVIRKFIGLSFEKKREMGISGREKIEKEFDRKIVTDIYKKIIESILED